MMGRRRVLALLVSVAVLGFACPALADEGGNPAETTPPAGGSGDAPTPPTEPDNSKSSLVLLGGQSAAQTVNLSESSKTGLTGTLVLALRSKIRATSLRVSYLPFGNTAGAAAGSVALPDDVADSFEVGQARSIPLRFNLPEGSSPEDLGGVVLVKPTSGQHVTGHRLEIAISGAGAELKGVSVRPEKLEIDVVGAVPTSGPGEASAGIQLAGPGVPALVESGTTLPFDLLLRSDHGDEAHARIVGLQQSPSDPAVATAEVKIEGTLKPGKYEGSAPIPALSPDAPKLSIQIESGNSFWWALLVVFVGAVVGGALYLASGIHRRKALLRDEVKSLLRSYADALQQVTDKSDDGELPLWTLDTYLGKDESKWYEVKWNAVLDFDGAVQTIWSDIHWARNDDDLDQVAGQVEELRTRIVRWITVANSIAALETAKGLTPKSISGHKWEDQKTPQDTERLLEQIRTIEPSDDKAAKELIDRINRQARWHLAMAEAWNAKTILTLDVTEHEGKYDKSIEDTMKTLDLAKLDADASPESKRDAEKQVDLSLELSRLAKKIEVVYKGDPSELKLKQPVPAESVIAAPTIGVMAAATGDGSIEESIVEDSVMVESEREEAKATHLGDTLRSASGSGSTHDGERIQLQVKAVVRRDLLWTAATALVASAAYIPTIYGPTWGTVPDYISAFAAGFLGKAAINWAALPFFRSLKPGKAATSGDEGAPPKDSDGTAPPADGATADGAATAIKPVTTPAPPAPSPPAAA